MGQGFFANAGKVIWSETLPGGAACVVYASPKEAQAALALNGSQVGDAVIQVDVWQVKNGGKGAAFAGAFGGGFGGGKGYGGGGFGGGFGGGGFGKGAFPPAFGGGGFGGGKGFGKKGSKLSGIPSENKIWIGGLPEGVTQEALTEFFQSIGKVTTTMLMKGGTACVAYSSPDEAQASLALDKSTVGGVEIQVDVWTKKT